MADPLLNLDSPTPIPSSEIVVPKKPQSGPIIKPELDPRTFVETADFNATDSMEHTQDGINSQRIQLRNVLGFINNFPTVPTYTPHSLADQVVIVDDVNSDPDNDRIYIYDREEKVWKFIFLNTESWSMTQLSLPEAVPSGPPGWLAGGNDPAVTPTADGAELYALTDTFAFTDSLIGETGYLEFSALATYRFEFDMVFRNLSANIQNGFGLWETYAGVVVADAVSPASTDASIRFVIDNTDLYIVCGDGAAVTAVPIMVGTLLPNQKYRFKFIWEPGVSVTFFVDGVAYAPITTTIPVLNGAFLLFAGSDSGGAGLPGYWVKYPRMSVAI